MLTSQEKKFIVFLKSKYALKSGLDNRKIEYEVLDENKNVVFSNSSDKFSKSPKIKLEKVLAQIEEEGFGEIKDFDDEAIFEWNKNFNKHYKEIEKLVKDAHSIIKSSSPKVEKITKTSFDFKRIEERNNKIVLTTTVFSTSFILSLFLLVFLTKPTLSTLNFFDSLVYFPFNKLEEAYNFNYNQGVFKVAQVDRNINQEIKSQYIKNLSLEEKINLENNILELSKKSIIQHSSSQLSPYHHLRHENLDDDIVVMGIDNSEELKENKNIFKDLIKKLAQKQIDLVDQINKKLLNLIK